MTEWYTYTVFDDRLKGCTTYDKNGNPIPHRHGFVYYGKQPKSPNELNDILENLVKMRRETEAITEIVGALINLGFKVDAVPKPDQEHFGNWSLLAYRHSLVIRVTNDRGLCLDVARSEIFNNDLCDRWVTWDAAGECIGVLYNARTPLDSLLFNLDAVAKAFSSENWPITKERLKEIEQEKRWRFSEMETKEEEAADVFVREHGEPLLDRAVYEEMRKINWKELREIRYKLFRQNLLDTIRRNLRV